LSLRDVAAGDLILPSRPHGLRHLIEQAASKFGLALRVRFDADSFSVLKDLTERGLGWAILPRSAIAREEVEGRLATAALRRPTIRRQVVLALPPGHAPMRATEAVLRILGHVVQARAAAGAWRAFAEESKRGGC
jgi:DNA-binding transcriptional LysR family regulator